MVFLAIILSMSTIMHAITQEQLLTLKNENPFSYNLGIKIIPGKKPSDQVTICCHGYGDSNRIVDVINSFNVLPGHLIGFNFPDYGITASTDHRKSTFGSINEILPLLYLIKRCVCDLHIPKLNLYGFSAGGGAIVNALAALNTSRFDAQLKAYGITAQDKKEMVRALERGLIVLDCPLKSIDEILSFRKDISAFEGIAQNYIKNNMRPIDSLNSLMGLTLNILVHFQEPDEILANRDDALFIKRLKSANYGKTWVVLGSDGGHNTYHASLWNYYKRL
jgi:hypothetical protein